MNGFDHWVLSIGVFLPLVGAAVMMLWPRDDEAGLKSIALITALLTLAAGVYMAIQFDYDNAKTAQFEVNRNWIAVINSHYHMDHIHGNAVFDDAHIIATVKTRERIATRGAELLALRFALPETLASLDTQIASDATAELHDDLAALRGDYRALDAALPELTLRLPDITFEQRLTLHGADRTVEILSYGGGHTSSDAFLWLPAERVAFLGDLLGVRTHPSFGQADLEEWDTILERIEALDITTAVPGHGAVGTLADIATLRQYLSDMETLVDEAIVRGETAEQVAALPPPAPYENWAARTIFTDNLRHLYALSARSAEPEPVDEAG